jgi:hypothetical protein
MRLWCVDFGTLLSLAEEDYALVLIIVLIISIGFLVCFLKVVAAVALPLPALDLVRVSLLPMDLH